MLTTASRAGSPFSPAPLADFAFFAAGTSSRQFFPRDPARAGGRIRARSLDCHAVALGVAFDFEGLLVPKLNVAISLPPAAGRAFLVCEVDFLHYVTLLVQ